MVSSSHDIHMYEYLTGVRVLFHTTAVVKLVYRYVLRTWYQVPYDIVLRSMMLLVHYISTVVCGAVNDSN